MKMILKYAAIPVFAAMILTACNSRPQLTGTWVDRPNEETTDTVSGRLFSDPFSVTESSGFTLLEDGSVLSINMGYREYYQWEKSGDMLIMKGKYTNNFQEYVDTMKIVEITDEKLCLEDVGGYSVTYIRK